jgi:hypothetical protein
MREISPDSRAACGERQGEGPGDWPQASKICESASPRKGGKGRYPAIFEKSATA